MKKIWSSYSYTILLLMICCFSALVLSLLSESKEENYIKITVSSGDTLWDLAEQYTDNSSLSKKQFINWVISHNGMNDKQLIIGDELILPIKEELNDTTTVLASAGE
jgi:cell division protein YceG involved in septum cleavage